MSASDRTTPDWRPAPVCARGLGGQEEHLVQLLRRQRLEHREQGAEGLADPGRRLGHQTTTGADGLEHRFGQVPLAGAKTGMGKAKVLRRSITRITVRHFLFGPMQKQAALVLEEVLQGLGVEGFDQAGFLLADDVEIHQRQVDLLHIELAAHQPAVNLGLRPVQLPMIGRLLAQVATVGFDLFEAVLRRVVAIRPALDLQLQVLAFQRDFTLILLATPRSHGTMPGNAFQRCGDGVKRRSRSPHFAVNSHSARTAML